jgi:hypothetical protein
MASPAARPYHFGMTTTTRDRIVCDCGHEGILQCRENDQPFSAMWEAYTLEGFDRGGLVITKVTDAPNGALAALNPRCPACGQVGKVRHA